MVHPGKENGAETTAPIEVETISSTIEEPSTAEETESAAPEKRYKTSDTLNVRSEPSTNASKLGQLAPGSEVLKITTIPGPRFPLKIRKAMYPKNIWN